MSEPLEPTSAGPAAEGASPSRTRRRGGGIALPLVLILVGVVLLLTTTGVIEWRDWARLWPLWPAILILVGVDILLGNLAPAVRLLVVVVVLLAIGAAGYTLIVTGDSSSEVLQLQDTWPLEGIEQGVVTLRMGTGQLELGEEEDASVFARVAVTSEEAGGWEPRFELGSDGVATLEISSAERSRPFLWFEEDHWRVALSGRVPLELNFSGGVGESRLDLSGLQVEELHLDVGIGDMEVILPARVERGQVTVRGGIGSVTILVPEGVGIYVEGRAGLGSLSVDRDRFHEVGDGYESENYDRAEYRLEVEAGVGIGGIEVRYR